MRGKDLILASFTRNSQTNSRNIFWALVGARLCKQPVLALAGATPLSKGHYRTSLSLGGRLLLKRCTVNLLRTGAGPVMALLAKWMRPASSWPVSRHRVVAVE